MDRKSMPTSNAAQRPQEDRHRQPLFPPRCPLPPSSHQCTSGRLTDAADAESWTHQQQAFGAEWQVGRRFGMLLREHMLRWSFSATGALRWKRDMGDYSEVLKTLGTGTGALPVVHVCQRLGNRKEQCCCCCASDYRGAAQAALQFRQYAGMCRLTP